MRPLIVLLAALGVGCAIQDVKQLDRFKTLASEGNDGAIVAETVDCAANDPGCDQLHLIRGMACYREAKQGVAPKPRYQCAIDELKTGIELTGRGDTAATESKVYMQALLESIRERQDLASNWEEGKPYTALLSSQAAAFRRLYPQAPDGYYYGATALFAEADRRLAQDDSVTKACELLAEAEALIETGSRHPGELAANLEQTGREIARTQSLECST
jgi:hypothetical protein